MVARILLVTLLLAGEEVPPQCRAPKLTPNVAGLCREHERLRRDPAVTSRFNADAGITLADVLHLEENSLAETACAGAVGKPVTPDVAKLALLAHGTDRIPERRWLICVARGDRACGARTGHAEGIVSALPYRYQIAVAFEDGGVTACDVKWAAGW